ncbi:MAG: ArsR family transcriptional regulator [Proteiniphilum sp.]|uniref:winged helix-turn-helix transcriptional regulator n=1 Tax=Proteiniphilum sp. TaxID=1926877 RepID=UPI002B204425|nr:ArsR family transcriptional regulator [Proteiniphilum sp.]MEA5126784.1 ArsR family transcriptional regulator [Proteiniphilum sp.]
MTEGRGTGIPIIRKEMRKNGSPEPRFETDDNYSYFITTLPVHPAFNSDDGLNDGVKIEQVFENKIDKIYSIIRDGVNDGVNELVEILLNISGLNATEIAGRMNKSVPTVERYLRLLRKKGIVEFVGAPKKAVITLLKRSITY